MRFLRLVCLACCVVAPSSSAISQGMGYGGWHVSQHIDKLTDEKVTRGARQYDDANYSVQVEVLCSGRKLSFSFSTFNRSDGSPLRQRTPSTLRLDNEQAVRTSSGPHNYQNEFTITEAMDLDISTIGAIQVALARRVLLKLELMTGSTLIELDQTDPRLKFVLAQCVKATDLGARQRLWAEKRRRERQAEQQAAKQEADQKAAAVAAEKTEDENYDVPLAGLNFRSQGSCSFEEYGQVQDRRCEFWFPSPLPETADRMVVIKKADTWNPNDDSYRFHISGDLAYVTRSPGNGSNPKRFQLKIDGGGCWAGNDGAWATRICIKPRTPKFQPA